MKFDINSLIERHGKKYRIVAYDGQRMIIECIKESEVVKLTLDEILEEYMNGTIQCDYPAVSRKQYEPTKKQWKRIEFRKPYAEAFNRNNISREEFQDVIRKIKIANNHDLTKSYPSRATAYRWAAIFARNMNPLDLR